LQRLEGESVCFQLRERYPQLKGKKLVLFLSRFDPKKGLDLLTAALGSLALRRKDFALVLAGSGTSDYEAKVIALVEKHGLRDRTVFLGFVQAQDKWSVLREVDIFVLPRIHVRRGEYHQDMDRGRLLVPRSKASFAGRGRLAERPSFV
ncbi:MAG: glycosyltransferase, partial [Chloroflexi bacterium]|nr:glycosyltransferase [Chloroflexota bacterium]